METFVLNGMIVLPSGFFTEYRVLQYRNGDCVRAKPTNRWESKSTIRPDLPPLVFDCLARRRESDYGQRSLKDIIRN
jgi:hypothetical protein